MSEKEYIARGEMLSELRSGFFPQDVVYTEAVSIAEQIIRAAPAAAVVARSEIAKIFEEIEREIDLALESNYKARKERNERGYYDFDDTLLSSIVGKINALRGMEYFIAELKKKYTGDQNDGI